MVGALRKKRLTREEKAQQTYDALMSAAALIVGERGYAATSIAKVTEKAGVSQGTFYNYFDGRQALFDKLLPHVGQQMISEIANEVPREAKGADREVERFRAYCRFLGRNPGFYRILYEAEIYAPKAHDAHIERISAGFRRSLERSVAAGEIRDIDSEELDAIIYALLGARAYIAMRYDKGAEIPDSAIDGYQRLVRRGLFS